MSEGQRATRCFDETERECVARLGTRHFKEKKGNKLYLQADMAKRSLEVNETILKLEARERRRVSPVRIKSDSDDPSFKRLALSVGVQNTVDRPKSGHRSTTTLEREFRIDTFLRWRVPSSLDSLRVSTGENGVFLGPLVSL